MKLNESKQTKWMRIACTKDTGKTKVFTLSAIEGGYVLGWIQWFGKWRQYAFFPNELTVFEKQCLQDITDFLKELAEERKKK